VEVTKAVAISVNRACRRYAFVHTASRDVAHPPLLSLAVAIILLNVDRPPLIADHPAGINSLG